MSTISELLLKPPEILGLDVSTTDNNNADNAMLKHLKKRRVVRGKFRKHSLYIYGYVLLPRLREKKRRRLRDRILHLPSRASVKETKMTALLLSSTRHLNNADATNI